MGNLPAVCVHAGNIHGTVYGAMPLGTAITKYPSIIGVCAGARYRGTFKNLVESFDIQVDISEEIKPNELEILPKRRRVERTFS